MNALLIESHYFPSIGYFKAISEYDEVYIEACESFQKQTYRNRTYLKGANKIEPLIVPINGQDKKLPFKDIKISYAEKWVSEHINMIRSAYGKAPFFEYYFPYIEKIILQKYTFLLDLNLASIELCLKLLQLDCNLQLTQQFDKNPTNYADYRSKIHPKKDILGINVPEYHQVFGKKFVANLSVLDTLFCEGSSASEIVRNTSFAQSR